MLRSTEILASHTGNLASHTGNLSKSAHSSCNDRNCEKPRTACGTGTWQQMYRICGAPRGVSELGNATWLVLATNICVCCSCLAGTGGCRGSFPPLSRRCASTFVHSLAAVKLLHIISFQSLHPCSQHNLSPLPTLRSAVLFL